MAFSIIMNRKLCIYDDGVIFNTDLNSVNVLSAIILNSPEEVAEYDSLDVHCGIVDRHISKKEMSLVNSSLNFVNFS